MISVNVKRKRDWAISACAPLRGVGVQRLSKAKNTSSGVFLVSRVGQASRKAGNGKPLRYSLNLQETVRRNGIEPFRNKIGSVDAMSQALNRFIYYHANEKFIPSEPVTLEEKVHRHIIRLSRGRRKGGQLQ